MKSLEILNNKSWELKDYKDCVINEEEFKTIKEHLEILEISLIKSVDLEDLFYLFNKYPGEDEYILECYNDCHKRKLTMAELQKIK